MLLLQGELQLLLGDRPVPAQHLADPQPLVAPLQDEAELAGGDGLLVHQQAPQGHVRAAGGLLGQGLR
jgi:hypothetical protein